MTSKPSVLVVDDDNGHRLMLEALLGKWGYRVQSAANGVQAVEKVREGPFDAVLMDIRMPDMDGITALKGIKSYNPAVPVVLMTAYSAVESAVEALKSGAYDYLIKPLDFDVLKLTLSRTLEHSRLKAENSQLRAESRSRAIVGNSPAIRRMQEMIETVAPSDATVLIIGKSGTGKELVAQALHSASLRADKPFITVNCAALPHDLMEAELFGYESGAFTGAKSGGSKGKFELADKGTIFLDEIGELPLPMQAKLLRVLESGEIQKEEIINLIAKRKVFPCYFGSALKIQGVEEFLRGIETFTRECAYPEEFGARVFKIARDAQGNRLTYLKITGGSLKVKMLLSNEKEAGEGKEELWEEKAEQIRIYSGNSFEAVKEAKAGSVCAVTGLSHT